MQSINYTKQYPTQIIYVLLATRPKHLVSNLGKYLLYCSSVDSENENSKGF